MLRGGSEEEEEEEEEAGGGCGQLREEGEGSWEWRGGMRSKKARWEEGGRREKGRERRWKG